ncbi:14673_t:CDS:1, partial [Racocetra fulgida]
QITKSLEIIKTDYSKINDHLNEPLFYMIPLYNWVCDKLHIFLRVTDRLWELMLLDLDREQVKETIWQTRILDKMKRLKIAF